MALQTVSSKEQWIELLRDTLHLPEDSASELLEHTHFQGSI